MLTVACVLSKGPVYNESHVERLHRFVDFHLTQTYEFVCVTDSHLQGWWAKIDLFKPGRFPGRVLYLDLDVTVTGNLDELADYQAPFVIIKDWNRIGYNSSVMAWDACYVDRLYNEFPMLISQPTSDEAAAMARFKGDQDYIYKMMNGAATFPKPWCRSFKRLVLLKEHTADMRVCVFHGQPKPWDVARWV